MAAAADSSPRLSSSVTSVNLDRRRLATTRRSSRRLRTVQRCDCVAGACPVAL